MGASAGETGKARERRAIAGINITPLTDVALVLLVVFMVTATFLGEEEGVDIRLPGASSATARQDVGAIMVQVEADGSVTMDGQRVEERLLIPAFRERSEVGGVKQVVIRGDRDASYEAVFAVMDAARLAGLADIALATQPQAASAPEDGSES